MARACTDRGAIVKKILSTEIPNAIDGEHKKSLRDRSVVNPEDVAFAVGPESWLADGREDYPVAPHIVGSILLAHDWDNKRTDDAKDAYFEVAGSRVEGTTKRQSARIEGNPVIWGSLSQTQLTIMGTNENPVLVISAAGRQTAKASEWLTAFLRRCRGALVAAHATLAKEKEEAQANLESLAKSLAKAKDGDKADIVARQEEQRKCLSKFEGKDIAKMAVVDAVANLQKEHDPVADELTQEHWIVIFRQSRKLGRPLVGLTYSAAVWLSVDYGSDLPTDRRSLEKSMLANLQVPSLPSTVADSVRRLIRDYVVNLGDSEDVALDKVRAYVRPLMAVGAQTAASESYVRKMYRMSMLCADAQRAIDEEKEPRKMLALFEKYTRILFAEDKEDVVIVGGDLRSLTKNALSEKEQTKLMNSPRREAVNSRKPKASAATAPGIQPEVMARLGAMRSPMYREISDAQREAVRAVFAWEAHRAGDKDALKDYPQLAAALAETVADEKKGEENKPLALALDAADHWDGKSKTLVEDLPEFCEKQPKEKSTPPAEYDAKLKAWDARRKAHEADVAAAKKLLASALGAIPPATKPDQRPVVVREWLEKNQS